MLSHLSVTLTTVLVLALSAMTAEAAQQSVIEHEAGVTRLADVPKRIVALEMSFVDALASVEVAPVGIADDKERERIISEYTQRIGDQWVSVGTRKTPNLEVIASLRPDLILADLKRHSSVYQTLSQIAPTIVLNSLSGDYHETLEIVKKVAKAVGKTKKMQKRLAVHKQKMQRYRKLVSPHHHLAVHFGVANAKNLWLHSPISYNATLLKELGFQNNMSGEFENTHAKTSLEQLGQLNPDVFLIGEYANPSQVDKWSSERIFKEMAAVKKGRVLNVQPHHWTRLRGIIAAEMKARDVVRLFAKRLTATDGKGSTFKTP